MSDEGSPVNIQTIGELLESLPDWDGQVVPGHSGGGPERRQRHGVILANAQRIKQGLHLLKQQPAPQAGRTAWMEAEAGKLRLRPRQLRNILAAARAVADLSAEALPKELLDRRIEDVAWAVAHAMSGGDPTATRPRQSRQDRDSVRWAVVRTLKMINALPYEHRLKAAVAIVDELQGLLDATAEAIARLRVQQPGEVEPQRELREEAVTATRMYGDADLDELADEISRMTAAGLMEPRLEDSCAMSFEDQVELEALRFLVPFRSIDVARRLHVSYQKVTAALVAAQWPHSKKTLMADGSEAVRWLPRVVDDRIVDHRYGARVWADLHVDDQNKTWDDHAWTVSKATR